MAGLIKGLVVGLAGGGAAASVAAMLSDLMEARRQADRKRKRESMDVDENTIALHVRKVPSTSLYKPAESRVGDAPIGENGDSKDVEAKVRPLVEDGTAKSETASDKPRDDLGRFTGIPKAASGWGLKLDEIPHDAAKMVGFAVGAPLAYNLVELIHQKVEKKRLEKQIAAAQHEYIDVLEGAKTAGYFGRMFNDDLLPETTLEKSAQERPDDTLLGRGLARLAGKSNILNRGGAVAHDMGAVTLAAMALLTGASAYAVNKLLRKKLEGDVDDDYVDAGGNIKNVIFKQGSYERKLTPQELIVTIGVMRDEMSHPARYMGKQADYYNGRSDSKVRAGLNDSGMSHWNVVRREHNPLALKNNSAEFRNWMYNTPEGREWAFARYLDAKGITDHGLPAWDSAFANGRFGDMRGLVGANMGYEDFDWAPDASEVGMPLSGVARKFGMSMDDLRRMNPNLPADDNAAVGNANLRVRYQPGVGRLPKDMGSGMQGDQAAWFNMIGSAKNKGNMDRLALQQVSEMGGPFGALMRIPVLGPWLQQLAGWFANNTRFGQQMKARQAFMQTGGNENDWNEFKKNVAFNDDGTFTYTAPKPAEAPKPAVSPTAVANGTSHTPAAKLPPGVTPPAPAMPAT